MSHELRTPLAAMTMVATALEEDADQLPPDAARTRGAADDSGQGSGLGTAIALENARLHGGTIEVADGPHGGAVFTLRLPARRTEGGTG